MAGSSPEQVVPLLINDRTGERRASLADCLMSGLLRGRANPALIAALLSGLDKVRALTLVLFAAHTCTCLLSTMPPCAFATYM